MDFSRRRFLGGAAVSVGLPFLPSLLHWSQRAWAAECPPAPKRFIGYYVPNGFNMPDWTPTATGLGWQAPLLLQPLEPVRRKLLVLSGLENQKVARPALPPGNHGGGTGCFLTQVHVNNNYNDPARTSIDQVIADQVGSCTRLPSLQLGTESKTGTCDGGPCDYSVSISWRKNTPLPNITSPQLAFDRIFAGADPTAGGADAERRRALRSSVLDHVRAEAASLAPHLSPSDRRKLDEYETSVRALETRIQRTGGGGGGSGGPACRAPAARPAATVDFREQVKLMTEIMALAFQCDATRVITFMLMQSSSGRDFGFIGAPGGYHGLSHHQGDRAKIDSLKKIGRWKVEQLAALLTKLDGIADSNGKTVLDNTCVFYSSEISDGDRHNHWDLPVILAGGLGGALRTDGRHLAYVKYSFPRPYIGPEGGRSLGDLFVSMLQGFAGRGVTSFGENGRAPLADVMPA